MSFILGSWQLSENESALIRNPGENFALCPNGLLVHDVQHDLLCFQPLKNERHKNEGRVLVNFLFSNIKI